MVTKQGVRKEISDLAEHEAKWLIKPGDGMRIPIPVVKFYSSLDMPEEKVIEAICYRLGAQENAASAQECESQGNVLHAMVHYAKAKILLEEHLRVVMSYISKRQAKPCLVGNN